MPRVIVRPALGQGPVAPVTDYVARIASSSLMRDGGVIHVTSRGTPILLVPYVPLQVSRLTF